MPRPDDLSQPAPLPASWPVAIMTSCDTVLRDAAIANLLLDDPGMVALRYDIAPGGPSAATEDAQLLRLVLTAHGVLERTVVELEHACLSCAMREDAIPALRALAADGRFTSALLGLPVASDPSTVAPGLHAQGREHSPRLHVSTVSTVLDSGGLRRDLLGDTLLAEVLPRWGVEDERALGEALAAQIAVSDLIIDAADGASAVPGAAPEAPVGRDIGICAADGTSPGAELLEHLRAPEQELLVGLAALSPQPVLAPRYDVATSRARMDPCTVQPWEGPDGHGTWTLDLASERPFHPERFLEQVEALGTGELRSRGRIWFPTRPGTVCQWDGAGGQVSIGSVGDVSMPELSLCDMDAALSPEGLPTTRLVITGIHHEDRERVAAAFEACLLTTAEWRRGLLPWLGTDDDLAPWLGERAAAA